MNRPEHVADTQARRLAEDVIRTFGEIRLRVFGTSMVPSIHPGDLITVERTVPSGVATGEIVLYSRQGRMFVHRVVDRTGNSDGSFLITRGDRLGHNDPPVSAAELLGRVTSIQRNDGSGNRPVDASTAHGESNSPLLRLLRTSDYATYLYVRAAAVWGKLADQTAALQFMGGDPGAQPQPGETLLTSKVMDRTSDAELHTEDVEEEVECQV